MNANLKPGLQNRIKTFLNAHPQHDIDIKLQGKESWEQTGCAVVVHLQCHNGECWMGLKAGSQSVDDLPTVFEKLLDEYAEIRPDHMKVTPNKVKRL